MQKITGPYHADMAALVRGLTLMRIRFGVIDTDAATTITDRQGTPELYYSTLLGVENETAAPARTYATFEPGRLVADGRQLIPPHSAAVALNEGFVSHCMSDADCAYADPPSISLTFSKKHTVVGFTIIFDQTTGDYPAQLRIQAWREGDSIADFIETPTAADIRIERPVERFDRISLTWLQSNKPYRRARLQQITFGLGLVFDTDTLIKATRTDEVDPLSRRLPVEDFAFTIENVSGAYNPDAPNSIWRYIEKRSPVAVSFGHVSHDPLRWGDISGWGWSDLEETTWGNLIDGGVVTWLNGGRYYLTGQPASDYISAKFTCKSILSLADVEYLFGVFRPDDISLYDLAEDVFRCANLPLIYDGEPPYKLWEGLRDIYTTAPLPVASCRECLQLIANAACCVMFTDRLGYVRIEPADNTQYDLHLNDTTLEQMPTVSKLPPLRTIRVAYYRYAPKGERVELTNTSFNVSGSTTLHIEYSASTDIAVQVIGGTANWTAYTCGMELTLTGNGEIGIVVTGVALDSSAAYYRVDADPPDESGEVETIKNPLITDYATAKRVALWTMDYLQNRNTYKANYRGNPEVDAADQIYFQSRFERRFPARVLQNKIDYNGTLSGSIEVKKLQKEAKG